jgi:hypothetical protein
MSFLHSYWKLQKLGIDGSIIEKHFCFVNDCSREDFKVHKDKAWKIWKERSKILLKIELGDYLHLLSNDNQKIFLFSGKIIEKRRRKLIEKIVVSRNKYNFLMEHISHNPIISDRVILKSIKRYLEDRYKLDLEISEFKKIIPNKSDLLKTISRIHPRFSYKFDYIHRIDDSGKIITETYTLQPAFSQLI